MTFFLIISFHVLPSCNPGLSELVWRTSQLLPFDLVLVKGIPCGSPWRLRWELRTDFNKGNNFLNKSFLNILENLFVTSLLDLWRWSKGRFLHFWMVGSKAKKEKQTIDCLVGKWGSQGENPFTALTGGFYPTNWFVSLLILIQP